MSKSFKEDKLEKVRELGYEVESITTEMHKTGIIPQDTDILCGAQGLERFDYKNLKDLKLVLLQSIGIDYLPLKDMEEQGITLCNNKGAYSIPIGEWIVFNMLEIVKQSKYFINNQREKTWKVTNEVKTLFGKTVLFLGTGTIAVEGAKRLQGFEMNVVGFNRSGNKVEYFNEICTEDNLKEKMQEADFIVAALPSTGKTNKFIDEEKLSWLKPEASIINISRGSVIDEDALVKALEEKRLYAAALDVFQVEPLPENHPFWDLENVYLFPHNSFGSEYTSEKQFETIYENLKRYKDGKELLNVVDFKKGY